MFHIYHDDANMIMGGSYATQNLFAIKNNLGKQVSRNISCLVGEHTDTKLYNVLNPFILANKIPIF